MPGGVFLSTGTTSTASTWWLILTGFTIVFLGALSLVPTYIMVWTLGQYVRPLQFSLVAVLLNVGIPADPLLAAATQILVNTVTFVSFLILLRLSPLAGYHAAEHMTVNAIERYGVYGWEPYVSQMPRAHPRCGSNLLAGIIPIMLVAVPLFTIDPVLGPILGVLVAGGSWVMRQPIGYFLQRRFTTKQPTAHQLDKGLQAGREVLEQWLADPRPSRILARRIWCRGMPQMLIGVICAVYAVQRIADQLPLWLDW